MVGVGIARKRGNQDSGSHLSDEIDNGFLVLERVVEFGVGHVQADSESRAQYFCGTGRFFESCLAISTGSHLAGSEVSQTNSDASFDHLGNGSGATEFNVVGMGANGENFDGGGSEFH